MSDEFNFSVRNEHWDAGMEELLFGPYRGPQDRPKSLLVIDGKPDLLDILVSMQLFPSRSQARKNWKHGEAIPPGFSDFRDLGKFRKRLTIWNPVPGLDIPGAEE